MRIVRMGWLAGLCLLVMSVGSAQAAVIGNWSGSSRTWNSSDMSILRALLQGEGHIVEADEAISAANLANDDLLVMGEPALAPTAGEMADLSNWVQAGGILLMLADSGGTGQNALNATAAALGSTLSWGGSAGSNTPLSGGNFATTGPPYNIVGQTLNTTPGTAVSGGTVLSGDYLRFEQVGLGFIFGFGDRLDHNFAAASLSNTNGQLFLNIAGAQQTTPVPEPATMLLVGAGLAAAGIRRRLTRA